jgi:hypothetical protein
MPFKNLVDSPTFTGPIVVPLGNERRRAIHLENIAQAFANRTAYLNVNSVSKIAGGTQNIAGNISLAGDLTVDDVTADDITADDINADNIACQNLTATADVNCDDLLAGEGTIGHLQSTTITVTGTIATTAGSITSASDIFLPGDERIRYTGSDADKRRLLRMRMCAGATTHPDGMQFNGLRWSSFNTAYTLSIPLPPLPTFTEIEQIWLRYEASGADGTVELVRANAIDWLITGSTFTVTSLGSAALTTGGGVKSAFITLGTPEVMSNQTYDYFIRVTGNASSSHDIYGAAVVALLYSPGID